MSEMRRLMMQLKLTVNEAKTHIRRLPQERFAFLGYDFGRYYSPKTGRAYLCPQPSKASVKRVIGKIRHATARMPLCKVRSAGRLVLSDNSRRLTPNLRIGRSFRRSSDALIAGLHSVIAKRL